MQVNIRQPGKRRIDLDNVQIVKLYNSGKTMREIANQFDVSPATIYRRLHECEDKSV